MTGEPKGALTRNRLLAGLSAVLVLAVLTGGAIGYLWPRSGDSEFGIDLNLPELGESRPDGFWFPVVVNDSGHPVADAKLDVSVQRDGHEAPLHLADSRDDARKKYDDFAPATGEKCRVPADDDFDEAASELTRMQYASSVGCERRLDTGENKYSLWMEIAGSPLEAFADDESGSATVKAELTIDGTTVATATETTKLKKDPRRHRVTVAKIPETVPADRTSANPHTGKITIANDSGKDLSGAVLTVEADPYSGIGLTGDDSCGQPGTKTTQPASLVCEDIDIPAGKSTVVKVRVYADPANFDEEKMKDQKLRVKVGKKPGYDDFAAASRGIWLETR